MKAQIIKNESGTPISVVVDYNDWQEIEQKLKLINVNPGIAENPLDWYDLTETSKAILVELMAYTSGEELKEMEMAVPDKERLQQMKLLFEEVDAINSEPENFRSISRMKDIISKYAPILRKVYDEV